MTALDLPQVHGPVMCRAGPSCCLPPGLAGYHRCRKSKGNRAENASWAENVESVHVFASAGFVWLLCQYSYKRSTFRVYFNFESSGRSHIGSFVVVVVVVVVVNRLYITLFSALEHIHFARL